MRALTKTIDISALRDNYHYLQKLAKSANIIAVIKADAYGHNAKIVAENLQDICEYFAVSCIEEALEIRENGINNPIILLEGVFNSNELPLCQRFNFLPTIHNKEQLDWIKQDNSSAEGDLHIWLKVDSGMHRLGFQVEELADIISEIKALEGNFPLKFECRGFLSHFACADMENKEHFYHQLEVLNKLDLPHNWARNYANSAVILRYPENCFEYSRAGIALYGISPFDFNAKDKYELKPVMQLETEIIATHYLKKGESAGYAQGFIAQEDGYIASIAIGYGDGFPRTVNSNSVPVMIEGKKYRLVGKIAMDISLVWLGKDTYKTGTRVEIFGNNLSVEEVADCAQTIPYTLTTALTKRVKLQVKK